MLDLAPNQTFLAATDGSLWAPMPRGSLVLMISCEAAAASVRHCAIGADWGRLGMLLANDGVLHGKQIIPKNYLIEATDWHKQPVVFAPKVSPATNGYGYQF